MTIRGATLSELSRHSVYMADYTAKDITVLEGLDPVRKRPGMYIGGVGTSGLHHLVWEILDNAVDEAMNGHASTIAVTLHADGSSITIADDGRGIPVDKHPKSKKSALEVIFTVLHAGGKFEPGNYKTAGGLHGVGASVVNALSTELRARVERDGAEWELSFKRGVPQGALRKVGAARGSGTTVYFRPDSTIFPRVEFDPEIVRERLEVVSYLHKGVRVTFENEAARTKQAFEHKEGLLDYLKKIVKERAATPVHEAAFQLDRDAGPRLELVMQWTDRPTSTCAATSTDSDSLGRHARDGLRAGLGKAVRNYIETHNLSPKGVTLAAEDIREGLTGVLRPVRGGADSSRGRPRTAEQSRGLVGDGFGGAAGARALAQSATARLAEAIVGRIILAARAREASRVAQAEVTRKTATTGRLNLPGKLSDCTNAGRDDTELFVVEGDSAGRNPPSRGAMGPVRPFSPLRGKVMTPKG